MNTKRQIMPLDQLRVRVAELMERFGYDFQDLRRATQVKPEAGRRFIKGGIINPGNHHVLDRWQRRYR